MYLPIIRNECSFVRRKEIAEHKPVAEQNRFDIAEVSSVPARLDWACRASEQEICKRVDGHYTTMSSGFETDRVDFTTNSEPDPEIMTAKSLTAEPERIA